MYNYIYINFTFLYNFLKNFDFLLKLYLFIPTYNLFNK